MAMTDFTIIRRSLAARLFSTVTTVITVAVAVGLLLVIVSLRDSGRRAFERGSGNMHLLVSQDTSPLVSVLNSVFYANPPARAMLYADYERLAASFPLDFAIPVQQGDSYRGFPVMATEPEFFTQFQPVLNEPWSLAAGRFFEGPFEVVLGSRVAAATGLAPGDTLFLTHGIAASRQFAAVGGAGAAAPHEHRDFTYTVVGVLEPTGSPHDRALFTDLRSSWIIHAHDRRRDGDPSVRTTTEADLLTQDRKITGIYLRAQTRKGTDNSAVLPQVFEALRRDPSVTVASPRQQVDTLFRIVGSIDDLFIALAAAVMLSSGIAIMLALYNSMEARRRQIAVLRVLGASRGRVFGLVMTESAIIGLLGAVGGLAIAYAGTYAGAGILREQLGLVIEPAFSLEAVLAVVVVTVALAAVAGLVPAAVAYRTSVAKNLRPIG